MSSRRIHLTAAFLGLMGHSRLTSNSPYPFDTVFRPVPLPTSEVGTFIMIYHLLNISYCWRIYRSVINPHDKIDRNGRYIPGVRFVTHSRQAVEIVFTRVRIGRRAPRTRDGESPLLSRQSVVWRTTTHSIRLRVHKPSFARLPTTFSLLWWSLNHLGN